MDDDDPIREPEHPLFAAWHWPWDVWLPLALLGCIVGWPVGLGAAVFFRWLTD